MLIQIIETRYLNPLFDGKFSEAFGKMLPLIREMKISANGNGSQWTFYKGFNFFGWIINEEEKRI